MVNRRRRNRCIKLEGVSVVDLMVGSRIDFSSKCSSLGIVASVFINCVHAGRAVYAMSSITRTVILVREKQCQWTLQHESSRWRRFSEVIRTVFGMHISSPLFVFPEEEDRPRTSSRGAETGKCSKISRDSTVISDSARYRIREPCCRRIVLSPATSRDTHVERLVTM